MKSMVTTALRGIAAGMALNSLICLISSYVLRLGYYAPCFVSLAEICGGELNAALVQTCAFGLAGAVAALLMRLAHHVRVHVHAPHAHQGAY